jgi:hypothetical protein
MKARIGLTKTKGKGRKLKVLERIITADFEGDWASCRDSTLFLSAIEHTNPGWTVDGYCRLP